MPNDAAYFRSRAAKERTLARLADNPSVATIHREMADNYSTLAAMAGGRGAEQQTEQNKEPTV